MCRVSFRGIIDGMQSIRRQGLSFRVRTRQPVTSGSSGSSASDRLLHVHLPWSSAVWTSLHARALSQSARI